MPRTNTIIGGNYLTTNNTQFWYRIKDFSANFASNIHASLTDSALTSGYHYIEDGTVLTMVIDVRISATGSINFSLYKNGVQEAGTIINITTTGLTENILDLDMVEGDSILMSSKGVGISGTWRWQLGVTGEFD